MKFFIVLLLSVFFVKLSFAAEKNNISYKQYSYTNDEIQFHENTEPIEEETAFRRFEVSFFLSLPFITLLSIVPFYIGNAIYYNRWDAPFPVYQYYAIASLSLGVSGYIAYQNTKIFLRYKRDHKQKEHQVSLIIQKEVNYGI